MFLSWTWFAMSKVAMVLSLAANALFAHLVYRHYGLFSKMFRQLLYVFAGWNALYSVAIQHVPHSAVIFVSDGWLSHRGQFSFALLTIRNALNFGTWGILALFFTYEYLVIGNWQKLEKVFVYNRIVIVLVYSAFQGLLVQTIVSTLLSNEGTVEYLSRNWYQALGEPVEDVNFLAGVFSDATDQIMTHSKIAFFLMGGVICGFIVFYVYIGVEAVQTLHRAPMILSSQSFFLHMKLLKTVSLMTSIEFVMQAQFPVTLFIGAIFNITFPRHYYLFSSAVQSMSPVVAPFAVILYLRPFRTLLISYFYNPKVQVITVRSADSHPL